MLREWLLHLFAAQAGEGRLVLSVDGGSVLTTTTSATRAAGAGTTGAARAGATAALAALTTATATALRALAALAALTAASATRATTAAAGTTAGTLGLNESGVKVDGLLDLALTLALLLAGSSGDVDILGLVLLKSLGASPLLVELAALVGLTGLEGTAKSKLLLGLLGEVVGVGDALVLGLGGLLAGGILGKSLLLLVLGNSLASLLVLKLSLAFGSTPGLGSLLLGTTANGSSGLVGVTVIAIAGVATTTATTDTGAVAATGTVAGGLVSRPLVVAVAAGTTVTESTLVAAGASTTVATAGAPHRSLGLDIALGGVGGSLVDSLDGHNWLLFTVLIVAEIGERVL
jgi:hypothetical protein